MYSGTRLPPQMAAWQLNTAHNQAPGYENGEFEDASQDIDAENFSDATQNDEATGGANPGGITNLSLDQLKAEGDNNN